MGITKCLAFDLPSGAGGMAAGIYKGMLITQLKEFSNSYNIHYKTKTYRSTLKVWFNENSHYTLFILVFHWDKIWKKPYFIDEIYQA